MAEISISTIGTCRYAPAGAANIEAYNYNGMKGLNIMQMVMALCIRRAAQAEEASVNFMNMISLGADKLDKLSGYVQSVLAADNKKWTDEIRPYLLSLGIDAKNLPANLNNYKSRMSVYEELQARLTALDVDTDRLGVELQTAISRRDTVFNMSSNTLVALSKSSYACASKLK